MSAHEGDVEYPEIEKVRIQLTEYQTLRSEIIARIGHAYQMMAVLGGSLVLLVGLAPNSNAFWALLGVVTSVIALGFWTFVRDMKKCARRIREIEIDVNQRAKEDLLVWENLWGADVNGYFGRSQPKARSFLAQARSPER